jgi:tetratricopeptide (TPR) repeat protein
MRRALRKDRSERYQSAGELAAAVEAAVGSVGVPAPAPTARISRRALMVGGGATVAAAALAALAAKLWWPSTGTAGHTLAVVLVENLTGDPALDWTDRGLCELLTTALAQSNTLAVLSTERIRAAAAHRWSAGTKLSGELAAEVATDAQADVFASGTLLRTGSGFRLTLRAQETRSGKLLYSGTSEGADPQALFAMADRAATEMLARVAPRTPAFVDSAAGLTSNVEALQAYAEAQLYESQFLMSLAITKVRRAVELDPDFAMAQMALSNYLFDGDRATSRATAARALAIARRRPLPLSHRRVIEVWALLAEGRHQEALSALERARRELPDDARLAGYLAGEYYRVGRISDAIPTALDAARLDPNSADLFVNLAVLQISNNDLPAALTAIDRYAALVPPNNWNAIATRADLFATVGRFDEALAGYRRAEAVDNCPALRRLLILLGRLDEADALLEKVAAANRRSNWWLLHADAEMRRGRLDGALASLEQAIAAATDPMGWQQWPRSINAAHVLFEQRDLTGALALADRLKTPWAEGVRGAVLTAQGRTTEADRAFAIFQAGMATVYGDVVAAEAVEIGRIKAGTYLGVFDRVMTTSNRISRAQSGMDGLDRVRALIGLNQLPAAELEVRAYLLRLRNLGADPDIWAEFSLLNYYLAQFYLAEILHRTGRHAEAVPLYRDFLSVFDRSSPALPQTALARAAIASR